MPKFRNVITGLAVSTAMAGGALALSTVSAHASTPTTATVVTKWGCGWDGHGHGRNYNKNKNKLVNRNDFRSFKYYRIKKVNRNTAAFASGDAVVDIDGDDDD
ncbi:hypothetical protein F5972_29205 [Microbispora cellulosiformans]|uniref:Lactococcin 972 family bacteriocin n=1 Tax=Microbispora cellulosiformans TaxID=2614688 RepID=A0A5J5JXA5_9ACTN|nr:hypothetical protein [Microbispora cellulosiformans]KAA9375041.1 hypothetical protein F5972_29205 [Microbispora cellulosiformans]